MALAIFWLIGITNAINLLDNMDGLASGIAIIAAGFLAFSFVSTQDNLLKPDADGIRRCIVGLPCLQLQPCIDFHGRLRLDVCRFLPCELGTGKRQRRSIAKLLPVLAVPILVLFIPIFDTTFVTVLRKLVGSCSFTGRARSYVASSGCTRNVRTPRGVDALRFCGLFWSVGAGGSASSSWMSASRRSRALQ